MIEPLGRNALNAIRGNTKHNSTTMQEYCANELQQFALYFGKKQKKQILFKYPNVKYDQSKVLDKVADLVKKDSAGVDPNLQ